MNKIKSFKKDYRAFLILLALLAGINLTKQAIRSNNKTNFPERGKIFVEITGDVKFPGAYNFSKRPKLAELINISGGINFNKDMRLSIPALTFQSGEKVTIEAKGPYVFILKDQMDAFNKLTLGIPLSLNQETAEGLTAIPGIGPKTANLIIQERIKRNGFKNCLEIMGVPGVGAKIYHRIRPFLIL
jgi:competence protein ComEA